MPSRLAAPPATLLAATVLLLACGAPATTAAPAPRPLPDQAAAPPEEPAPLIPPKEAFLRGWMPTAATGVDAFLRANPTYDGRGVLIGILDSGIDPGIPGLDRTSTGERKLLDLRDFSGEGAITLAPVSAEGDAVVIAGHRLAGMSRVRAQVASEAMYGGVLPEIRLGDLPASDVNGDGDDDDALPVLVARASDGWVLYADTDGDGSLANERPIHDYLVARETFGWHAPGRKTPLTLAVNLRDESGRPHLDLFFDTSAHGSHVAGIAAGRAIYGVAGFDGVAPGAMLLGLKIADNAQGGISTTGSMVAAIRYALRFARERKLPLVLNMSFGVGNEREGQARIDQVIDSVLGANPDVVFTISAGNDGPGLSTMGFPGSSARAITVGATFPAVFLGSASRGGDPVAYFSSRGGELAKPDIVAPGLAYSTVPRWNTGDERKGGTSMASPHAAGLAALLVSGLAQSGKPVEARLVRQALMVTATPLGGDTYLDDGTGQPDVGAAWRWLTGTHRVPEVAVAAVGHGVSAAYQARVLGADLDTLQRFNLTVSDEGDDSVFTLRSSAPWLRTPGRVTLRSGANAVTLSYDAARVSQPGVYVGVVTGRGRDSLAGPAFRLVNTLIVADTASPIQADLGRLAAGTSGRVFFRADADRPFAVAFGTGAPSEQVLAYLHEPGGQPYREESGIGAGYGDQTGVFMVDGRDVVPGLYEGVAVAPPLDGVSAAVGVHQSPVTIQAARSAEGVEVRLHNVTGAPVTTDPFLVLVGAERAATVTGRGAQVERVRFTLPAWAVHATVDVALDPQLWPLLTDFGVTLFDAEGRQLGKSPLNYAFGRLHIDLARADSLERAAELVLFPGFADPGSEQPWSANLSIRLYTDSANVERIGGPGPVSLGAGQQGSVILPMGAPLLRLGSGFVPLGIVVVPEGDRTWTREVPLPSVAGGLNP